MKKRELLFALVGTVLLSSCVKDKYNLGGLTVEADPSFAIPLIETDFVTEDILQDLDTNLIFPGTGNVLTVVFNDTLKSIGLDEFVDLTPVTISDNITLTPVAVDDVTKTQDVTLESLLPKFDALTEAGIRAAAAANPSPFSVPGFAIGDGGEHFVDEIADFSTLTFSEGELNLKVSNGFTFRMNDLQMELISIDNGVRSVLGTLVYPLIEAGGEATDKIDLAGKTMSDSLMMKIINFESVAPNASLPISLADKMVMEINLANSKITSGTAILPSKELASETFNISVAPVAIQADKSDSMKLTELKFLSGTMAYIFNYGIAEDANLTLTLPFATKAGVVFSEVISLTANTSNITGNFDLSEYVVDLTNGGTTVNAFQANVKTVLVSSGLPVAFSTSNVVSYDFTVSNIKPESITGDFGQQPIDIANEKASTGLGDDEILSTIELVAPVINLHFDNSFGIPMGFTSLAVDLTGGSTDVTLTGLNFTAVNPFNIAKGATGSSVTSTLVIDNTTTNIAAGINAQPKEFLVNGAAILNPAGSAVNFADTSSRLTVRVNVEVPLHGRITNFEVLDTTDMDLSDVFDNLKSATLKTTINNEFPLDGTLQIYFTDDNYNKLDSLVQPGGDATFLQASTTDANGITTAASLKSSSYVLSEETVKKLVNTTKAIVVARVSSSDNGADVMKILSTYKMSVKLGLIAQISLGDLTKD